MYPEKSNTQASRSSLLSGIRWLVTRLLFCYVMIAVLLTLFQDHLLYHPNPGPEMKRLPKTVEPYALTTDVALRGWVIRPQKPDAVIYLGGNGEAAGYALQRFVHLLPEHAVYLLDYRGFGNSSGKPNEQGFYRDALALYDQIASTHRSVSAIGRSLGSGIATFLAAHRELDRLVLVTPYDSVLNLARERYFLFPVSLMLRDKYESWRNVRGLLLPTLILLAETDHSVPHASSQRLIDAFPMPPQVTTVAGSTHYSIDMDALDAFFSEF